MSTAISFTQHAAESRFAMNNRGAAAPEASGPEIPVKDMNLSALYQLQDDPYTQAQQVIDSNPKAFKPPASPVLSAFPAVAVELELEARALSRQAKSSSDTWQAAQTELDKAKELAESRGLSAKKKDQGTPVHIKALEDMIGNIHDNYQKTYADINQKSAKYMQDVNTALGKISDHIKAGKEGKIDLDHYSFMKEMHQQFDKYTDFEMSFKPESSNPVEIALNIMEKNNINKDKFSNWSPDDRSTKAIHSFRGNESEYNFWSKKLGDGFIVEYQKVPVAKNGVFLEESYIKILPNLTPIRNIFSALANSSGYNENTMSSQAFQSLQASLDSQKNTVNSSVSQLLERFRQDNSTFETFIQLLVQMTKDLHQYNQGYM